MSIKAGERLSGIQISILVASTMIGTGLMSFPRRVAEAGKAAGITYVVISSGLIVLFTALTAWLNKKFPDMTVIEYSEVLLGKVMSKIIVIIFALFYVLVSSMVLRSFADIVKAFLLENTPLEVIIIGMLILAAYLSKNGINPIVRLCETFFPVFSLSILLFLILALQNFDAINIYSLWQINIKDMFRTMVETLDVFLGFEVVLFAGAFALDRKNLVKFSIAGSLFAALLNIISLVIAIGVFTVGGLEYQMYPLLELSKSVVFPGAFAERFDLFFAIFWVLAVFTTVAVVYYLAAFNITRVVGLRNYRPMCIILMPVVYFISLIPQNINQTMILNRITFSLCDIVILGIILLLVLAGFIEQGRERKVNEKQA